MPRARLKKTDVQEILLNYGLGGLEAVRLLHAGWNIAYDVRTAHGRYVLKVLQQSGLSDLRNELRILAALEQRIPHLQPVLTKKGSSYVRWHGRFVYIVPFIEGEIIHEGTTYSAARLREVGLQLALLHKTKMRGRSRYIHREFSRRFGRMHGSPARDALHYLESRGFYDAKLPRGFLHADLHSENVIWNGDRIALMLDFEESYQGPFLHDLGWVMLDTCFRKNALMRERVKQVLLGYESMRRLTAAERQYLEDAIIHAGILEMQYVDIARRKGERIENEGSQLYRQRMMSLLRAQQRTRKR